MFYTSILVFGIGGSTKLAAFKLAAFTMELFVNKSQQLEATTIATESSILYVAGVSYPPLKSIDKLR